MIELRVSKYNPNDRNSEGAYSKDTWTSISDIGKIFEGKKLTLSDYLDVEANYLKALNYLLDYNRIQSIDIVDSEYFYDHQIKYIPLEIKDDCELYFDQLKGKRKISNKDDIIKITLLALREILWCKLEHRCGFYIHFGYDFYMYSCLIDDSAILPNISGIYFEKFDSPYKSLVSG